MSIGDYVWVRPVKRGGIVTHIQPPSVVFPTEVIVVDFMDGSEPVPLMMVDPIIACFFITTNSVGNGNEQTWYSDPAIYHIY